MADPFVAEIRMFTFNFAPKGWAMCNGQLLPISQNTALFSLLGVAYGGDGKVSFGLPNLQGRVPMCWGQGPGTNHVLGEMDGSATVTLLTTQMPAHNHPLTVCSGRAPGSTTPEGQYLANGDCKPFGSSNLSSNAVMHPQVVNLAGGSQGHNNMMPSLVLNFCIALQGVFPPRS